MIKNEQQQEFKTSVVHCYNLVLWLIIGWFLAVEQEFIFCYWYSALCF